MKYIGRAYKAPSGQWSWAITEHGATIQAGAGYDDEDSAIDAMEAELAAYNEPSPSSEIKNLEEIIFGEENQRLASQAVTAAVAHAIEVRRQMVERVNANQRLEGYEPDEQLQQLQARFIEGELTTTEMLTLLTNYASQKGEKWPMPELTSKQFEIISLIDTYVSEHGFSGFTIDPLKIIMWKKYVIAGLSWENILLIIKEDKEKIIAVRPKQEYPDFQGMKSMGGGYYISSDD